MLYKKLIGRKFRQILNLVFVSVVLFFICLENVSYAEANQQTPDFSQINSFSPSVIAQTSSNSDRLRPNSEVNEVNNGELRINIPWFFQSTFTSTVIFTFAWLLIGVSVNYGYRMYWNSPIHPSFMPFVFVTVAATIAFSVVMAFNITIDGSIEFEVLGQKFSGASGPAILWVFTFLAIMAGFRLTNAEKLASSDEKANPPSHHLWTKSSTKDTHNS